jgi:hypothetical protein
MMDINISLWSGTDYVGGQRGIWSVGTVRNSSSLLGMHLACRRRNMVGWFQDPDRRRLSLPEQQIEECDVFVGWNVMIYC